MPGVIVIFFWWIILFPIVCVLAAPVILTRALFSKNPFISTTKIYYRSINDWFRSWPNAIFTHRADTLPQKLFYSFIITLFFTLFFFLIFYFLVGLVVKINLHDPAVIAIPIVTFFAMWIASLGGIFTREKMRDKPEIAQDQIRYKVAKGFGFAVITIVGIMMLIMILVSIKLLLSLLLGQ